MKTLNSLFSEYIKVVDKKKTRIEVFVNDLAKILKIEEKVSSIQVLEDKVASVIDEFESCSGHSITNLLRKFEVKNKLTYVEVLKEACDAINVKQSGSVFDLEKRLSVAFFDSIWKEMSDDQKQELNEKIIAELPKRNNKDEIKKLLQGASPSIVLGVASNAGFALYIAATSSLAAVSSSLGLGLGFGAYTTLTSSISTILGPIGWSVSLGYLSYKLGTPNYRTKVIPCILVFASMRGEIEAWNNTPWFKKIFKRN